MLGALGSCTAITTKMYAHRKGWPLKKVKIRLRHEKQNSKDSSQAATDRFYREITFVGDLNETQENRLLEIAEKCPVHRTLTENEVIITSRLAGKTAS